MAKANGKLPKDDVARIDKFVRQYIELRNHMKAQKAAFDEFMEPLEEMKRKLAGHMLELLDSAGIESAKTDEGTVYVTHPSTASLSDPDAFMEYVAEHGAYELMDRRANSTACREFAEENGELPPGVKLTVNRTIGVRS